MEQSCPRNILDRHNEEHSQPNSLANQLMPGMRGINLEEGDCAMNAFRDASSPELQRTMDEEKTCQNLGTCMLDRTASA